MSNENYRKKSHLSEDSFEMDITEIAEESANIVQGGRRRFCVTKKRPKKGKPFPLIRRMLHHPSSSD
jgi:hypothetical protein